MSPRPVIAAVNGAAAGGGNELVVACDIAIASEKATFGQTGVRVGSAPVLGGTNFLSMSVGEKRAKEIAFMCRRYPADQALEMGLINAVVPHEQLEEEVTRWADELLYMSPRYLEIAKVNSNVWWNQCRDNYLSGLGMLVQAIGSADMIEGGPPRLSAAGRPRRWTSSWNRNTRKSRSRPAHLRRPSNRSPSKRTRCRSCIPVCSPRCRRAVSRG
jgi:enoyl-CoA hydratase/carnithine racemase